MQGTTKSLKRYFIRFILFGFPQISLLETRSWWVGGSPGSRGTSAQPLQQPQLRGWAAQGWASSLYDPIWVLSRALALKKVTRSEHKRTHKPKGKENSIILTKTAVETTHHMQVIRLCFTRAWFWGASCQKRVPTFLNHEEGLRNDPLVSVPHS